MARPVVMGKAKLPEGLLANALPAYYLVRRETGDLWVMWDRSTSDATGAQVQLGIIPAAVLDAMKTAKEPLVWSS